VLGFGRILDPPHLPPTQVCMTPIGMIPSSILEIPPENMPQLRHWCPCLSLASSHAFADTIIALCGKNKTPLQWSTYHAWICFHYGKMHITTVLTEGEEDGAKGQRDIGRWYAIYLSSDHAARRASHCYNDSWLSRVFVPLGLPGSGLYRRTDLEFLRKVLPGIQVA
jgi:hypothetical protein